MPIGTTALPALLTAMIIAPSVQGEPRPTVAPPLALTHVNVIDVATGRVDADRTLLMRNGRIVSAQSARTRTPAGYRAVNGRGGWAIPGLWDAHVHLSDASLADAAAEGPAFLAAGVTSVRDMGGDLSVIDTLRELEANGQARGPHILRPGPFIDGPKEGAPDRLTAETAAQGVAAVGALKAERVDFIKIHNGVSRDAFFAVAGAARAARLRVAVHLPHSVSAEEAADAGAATL